MSTELARAATALYEQYLGAVNADSDADRARLLAACAAPQLRLTSFAPYQIVGRDAVAAKLTAVALVDPTTRLRLRRSGAVQEQFGVFRVPFEGVAADGTVVLTGEHVAEVTDGVLSSVTAFDDPAPLRQPFAEVWGRRVVVTGGSHGIGAAIVLRLAAAGASVVTCGRDAAALDEVVSRAAGLSGEVTASVADLADWDQLDGFLAGASSALGGVDVLVNNAGETALREFLQMDESQWEQSLRINLLAAVRATRTLVPAMIAQRWGRVIMLSSSGAKYPTAPWIDYAAAKAAVAATGKALARELAPHNVLVNTLLPGLIRTPMTERSMAVVGAETGTDLEAVAQAWAADVPLGRWGRPEEIADVVLFLCSEHCTYVNGVALDLDGGMANHVY